MNTFAAMMPAPRPADAVAPRAGADAVSPDGAAAAFGAVLGALGEGRPAKDADRGAAKTADDAAGPAPAEAANPLLDRVAPVDAGTVPPAPALDPAALLALIARAGAMPAAPVIPTAAAAMPAGPTASEHVPAGRGAAVPAGVADLAAGIVFAAGANGRVQDGLQGPSVGGAPGGTPAQAVPAQGVSGPRDTVEVRPQVTVLRQETHFAPVKPRLVVGEASTVPAAVTQAAPNPAIPGPTGAPASLAPAPIPPALATITEATRDGTSSPDVAPVTGIPAAETGAGAPVGAADLPRAPAPEPSGTARRTDSGRAPPEMTVASPTAQRIAGQAAPVEAADPSPGEVVPAEAGRSEAVAPAAPAPDGTPPSAAPLGAPARQVAEAVAAELSRPVAAASAVPTTPGGEGPLRLLTIQLRPMDLGTVLVRMRLRDGQLEMSLHASREETAALLRQDGALLADLLRQSGYQPDSVTIGANAAGGATQGDGGRQTSGAPFQPGGQGGGQGGQAHAGAQSDQASRRPGAPTADDRSDLTNERTHETNASGPDRSGRYL